MGAFVSRQVGIFIFEDVINSPAQHVGTACPDALLASIDAVEKPAASLPIEHSPCAARVQQCEVPGRFAALSRLLAREEQRRFSLGGQGAQSVGVLGVPRLCQVEPE